MRPARCRARLARALAPARALPPDLASISPRSPQVSPRTLAISSYALCGFANLGSAGIVVGSLGAMAPHQRPVLCKEVIRALVAGSLACFATACVAGALYDPALDGGNELGEDGASAAEC